MLLLPTAPQPERHSIIKSKAVQTAPDFLIPIPLRRVENGAFPFFL
jgi:hypothetical protein